MVNLREALAENQHEIWSHWMNYLFSVSVAQPDGSVLIPLAQVVRWVKQVATNYEDLSEKEKDSDREQADKVLKVAKPPVLVVYMPDGYWADFFLKDDFILGTRPDMAHIQMLQALGYEVIEEHLEANEDVPG